MNRRVIVTRPQREAQRWVRDLSALGLKAEALPLISVGPVADLTELQQAWQRLAQYVGVMFVSGNAVDYFFAARPALDPPGAGFAAIKPRAWATGPGTARALLRAGVAPERLDAPAAEAGQFDSEALWQVVAAQVQPRARVLIVRGGDAATRIGMAPGIGRDWFAQRLAQAGAQAEFVVAYQRCAPDFSPLERALACQAATDGSVWLLSSTEALANLCAWLPSQSWSSARALATHPRIAAAAKKAGFGVVRETRPTLPELVASIESMR